MTTPEMKLIFCEPILRVNKNVFLVQVGKCGGCFEVTCFSGHPTAELHAFNFFLGDKKLEACSSVFPASEHLDFESEVSPQRLYYQGIFASILVPSVTLSGRHEVFVKLHWSDGTNSTFFIGQLQVSRIEEKFTNLRNINCNTAIICMATYRPNHQLLDLQIKSIRQQTYKNWICIIQDDASPETDWQKLSEVTKMDPRFILFRNTVNLGFYENFELLLNRVPKEAGFVALADQDDNWYPEKLMDQVTRLRECKSLLSVSDCNVTDASGNRISDSFWMYRDNTVNDWKKTFFLNSVTGCCSLFKAELLEIVLPFPKLSGLLYHDHWIACAANWNEGIKFNNLPLLDYIQHGNNHTGLNSAPKVLPWWYFLLISFKAVLLNSWVVSGLPGTSRAARRARCFEKEIFGYAHQELARQKVFACELKRRTNGKRRGMAEFTDDVLSSSVLFYLIETVSCLVRKRTTHYAEAHSFFCILYLTCYKKYKSIRSLRSLKRGFASR